MTDEQSRETSCRFASSLRDAARDTTYADKPKLEE